MRLRDRRLPSPALAIACLALFVALGGTVLAATKIDGKTIRPKSLPGNRLAPRSLPANRIMPGALGGTQIDAGSLGQVPSAGHADSADTARRAQTATAADHATDSSTINGHAVGCPELTRQFAGACWDLRARPVAASAPEAVAVCASAGGELPDPLALLTFAKEPGVQLAPDGEWVNEIAPNSETGYGVYFLGADGVFHLRVPQEPRHFRCVTPLIH